jgi:hypothetical protein
MNVSGGGSKIKAYREPKKQKSDEISFFIRDRKGISLKRDIQGTVKNPMCAEFIA